jgi:hypothetical protein
LVAPSSDVLGSLNTDLLGSALFVLGARPLGSNSCDGAANLRWLFFGSFSTEMLEADVPAAAE